MMDNRQNFHHDDLPILERSVDAVLRDPIPADLPPDQVMQLVAVVQRAANQPCASTLIQRIKNMRAMTRIAVAATVLLALVGLMFWSMSGGGVTVAFADVVEALKNVHSATWKITAVATFKPPGAKEEKTITTVTNCMFLAPCYERTETTKGEKSIAIVDGQKNKMLVLLPARKMATIVNSKNQQPRRSFQSMQQYIANAQSGKAGGKVERLGLKTIDGRSAEGFRIQTGSQDARIWADPKTLLPIRIEQIQNPNTGPKGSIVLSDFRINPDLDKSLFSLDAPPGYTVRTVQRQYVPKLPQSAGSPSP
jgi:outer membrane lipoprotein-sorting protein